MKKEIGCPQCFPPEDPQQGTCMLTKFALGERGQGDMYCTVSGRILPVTVFNK